MKEGGRKEDFHIPSSSAAPSLLHSQLPHMINHTIVSNFLA